MLARRDKELEYMRAREKRVDDYEQQLQHLRLQDSEEYNQVKIKLETDVQVSTREYQKVLVSTGQRRVQPTRVKIKLETDEQGVTEYQGISETYQ